MKHEFEVQERNKQRQLNVLPRSKDMFENTAELSPRDIAEKAQIDSTHKLIKVLHDSSRQGFESKAFMPPGLSESRKMIL